MKFNMKYSNRSLEHIIKNDENFSYMKPELVHIDEMWLRTTVNDFAEIVSVHATADDTSYDDIMFLAKIEIGKGICENYMFMPCDGKCGKCAHAEIKYKWYVVPKILNILIEEIFEGVNMAWRVESSQSQIAF